MAGINYYLLWPEADLLAEHRKIQEGQSVSIMSTSQGDSSVTLKQNVSPQVALRMVEAALYALDPVKYAVLANNAPVSRTTFGYPQNPYLA